MVERDASRCDLLCWLVEMGRTDRDQYRVIREALWALYADADLTGSRRSDKPSKMS